MLSVFSYRILSATVPAGTCQQTWAVTVLLMSVLFEQTNIGQIHILEGGSEEGVTVSSKKEVERSRYHLLPPMAASCCPRAGDLWQGLGALFQETVRCLKWAVGRRHNRAKVQLVFDLLCHMFCLYD